MNRNSDVRTDIGWNQPSQAPRNGLLVAVLGLTLGLGVLAVGAGLVFVVNDLADSSEEFHGLGVLIGAVVGILGLVMATLAGIALRYRSSAPGRTRVLGLTLGGVLVVGMLLGGTFGAIGAAPLMILGVLLLAAAWFAPGGRA